MNGNDPPKDSTSTCARPRRPSENPEKAAIAVGSGVAVRDKGAKAAPVEENTSPLVLYWYPTADQSIAKSPDTGEPTTRGSGAGFEMLVLKTVVSEPI